MVVVGVVVAGRRVRGVGRGERRAFETKLSVF